MKKLLAILLMLTFLVSTVPVFAAESAHGVTEFANGTEYMYNLKTIGVRPYQVTSTACTVAKYTSSANTGSMTVFQLPIPEISESQTFSNYTFRVCTSSAGNLGTYIKLVKLDGLDWSKITSGTTNLTEEPLASAFKNYEAYRANSSIEAVKCTAYPDNYYYLLDITDYAKFCRNNGQTVMHVGVYTPYAKKVYAFSDSSFSTDDERIPYTYFTAESIPAMEYLGSDIEDSIEKTPACETNKNSVTFSFNNLVKQVSATVNGEASQCSVIGSKVTVSNLDFGSNDVSVTAADANGVEATASQSLFVFENYDGYDYLKEQSYTVNSDGSSYSGYNPSSAPKQAVVWSIPLPTVESGKEISQFNLRFLSPNAKGESYRLIKLPGENWDKENLVFITGEVAEGKVNIEEYISSYPEYKANIGTKSFETSTLEWADNDNGYLEATYADLTKYAKECIENGQSKMWLAIHSTSTCAITGIGNTQHAPNGRVHYVYWKFEDAEQTASVPKVVLSSDENTYANATALTALSKDATYKFVTKLSNFEAEDKEITLIIAKYDSENTLTGVAPVTVTVAAGATNVEASSPALAMNGTEGIVKAFIIAEDDSKPVIVTHITLIAQ